MRLWQKFSGSFSTGFLASVFGSGMTRIGGMAAGFVFFLLIAQTFGPDTIGRYAISAAIMAILAVICNLGLSTSIVRFISSDLENNKPYLSQLRLYWIVRVIGSIAIITSLLLGFSRDIIAQHVFSDPALAPYLLVVSLALFPVTLNLILSAYHHGHHRISLSSALRNMFIPLFSCLFFVALTYFSINGISSIIAQAIAVLVSCLLSLFFFWRHRAGIEETLYLSGEEKNNMLAVSLPMLTGGISGMLLGWVDTLMLGAMADAEAAGLYATAFRLCILVSLPLLIVEWAAMPRFAAAYKTGNTFLLQKTASDAVHLSSAAALIPLLLFVFLGPYILSLFGSEFVSAYWPLVILSLAHFILVSLGSSYTLMIVTNLEKQYQNIMISAVILNVILNFILIQAMGIIGAALATLLTEALKQSLYAITVYKHHGIVTLVGFAWIKLRSLNATKASS